MTRRGLILAIVGTGCWIALLAIVLGSVFASRKVANVRGATVAGGRQGQARLSDPGKRPPTDVSY